MESTSTAVQQALQNLNITELNTMQLATLEASENHKHIILLSATGSGKTLAFLLPLWKKLQQDAKGVQAIIIVPSRELAIQIDDVLRKITNVRSKRII
jgi:ATP-independent RNA helicase DbpA